MQHLFNFALKLNIYTEGSGEGEAIISPTFALTHDSTKDGAGLYISTSLVARG